MDARAHTAWTFLALSRARRGARSTFIVRVNEVVLGADGRPRARSFLGAERRLRFERTLRARVRSSSAHSTVGRMPGCLRHQQLIPLCS